MTKNEETLMRQLEVVMHKAAEEFMSEAPPEIRAKLIGTMLAGADALFAIRDGKPWRGIKDPRKIAGKLLQEIGMGD